MRRLIVSALLLLLISATYGLAYAEDSGAGDKKTDPKLLKNVGFEETLEDPSIESSFPFGWHKFVASGGRITLAYGADKNKPNGITINSTNPKAIYSNMSYINLQDGSDLLNLAGKEITFSARVRIDDAGGQTGSVNAGTMIITQGKDFEAKDEAMKFSNFASVNVLFSYNPALVKDELKDAKAGIVPASAKVRTLAVKKTNSFIELSCKVTIPKYVNEALFLLECKGVASATFQELNVKFPDGAKLIEPYNLSLSEIIPVNDNHPKGWFYKPGGDNAYITQSNRYKKSGEYSIEIGNPDPVNNSENVAFNVNFDIGENRALWGKKVKIVANVRTDMAIGISPSGKVPTGKRTITRVEEEEDADVGKGIFADFRELLKYNNYASVKVVCRKKDGKVLASHTDKTDVRDLVFGKTDWTEVSAEFVVPPRTYSVEWTLVTRGAGRAWFDDVSIDVEDNDSFQLENLGFEKIYGKAPKDWRLSSGSSAIIVTDPDDTPDGKGQSLLFINPNFGQSADIKAIFRIPAKEVCGYKVVLTGDIKSDLIKADFTQNIYLLLHPHKTRRVDITCLGAWPKSITLTGKSDWNKNWKAALIVHDEVTALSVVLGMKGIGKARFDNIKLVRERLAFPASVLANPSLTASSVPHIGGWDVEGVKDFNRAPSFIYNSSPAWGTIDEESGTISQDLDQLDAVLEKLIGKPITLKAMVKCEGSTKAAVGFEFFDKDMNSIQSVFADGTNDSIVVNGVPSDKFLFSPYRLSKLTTTIPAKTAKVRAVLKLSGVKGARFQVSGFRLMGADNAPSKDEIVKSLTAEYAKSAGYMKGLVPQVAFLQEDFEMSYSPRPADRILSNDPFFKGLLSSYGVSTLSEFSVPGGAFSNKGFVSAKNKKPTSYKFDGVKVKVLLNDDVNDEMYNYHVIPASGDMVTISQKIEFPKDTLKEIIGKEFKFSAYCYSNKLTDPKISVEFLGSDGSVIDTISEAIPELTDKQISSSYLVLSKSDVSVSGAVPPNTVSARVFVSGSGNGNLILGKTGVRYIFLSGGFFDKIAYLMIFDFSKLNVLIGMIIFGFFIIYFIYTARKRDLFIRKIAGLDSVDEAVGRATEMGKPILFCPGLDPIDFIGTIAAINILGRVAEKIAEYDTPLLVPNRDAIVMTICQETVKSAFLNAGRPDAFLEDSVYFVTDQQFAYVSAVAGTMMREKPAANFYMGGFYAESLILAETGALTGAIQVAGTDSIHQLPFFIVACDYTLIGEELYAASAYLSREPMQMGSLKGSDYSKMAFFLIILVGCIAASINSPALRWLVELLKVQ